LRVLALDPDLIVFVSRAWQTSCLAVRAGEEAFVIDSPVYPDELEALPAVLEQASFPVAALLATHGDWDHLLGRLAFPGASLGTAESTAARLRDEPGAAARELRRFDEQHYVERPAPLKLGTIQALPVPGRLELGAARELELHPAEGHTADGMAIAIPRVGVLACGDYLSPVEIPMISPGGSLEAYAATLARLRPLVEGAETVIAGHGGPLARDRALGLLEEDAAYLDALAREGIEAPLPPSRRGARQREIHAENAARARGATPPRR
jgi:glyoxylase-like metal-dependent hydrolase (beta-lactamase superfamily II)